MYLAFGVANLLRTTYHPPKQECAGRVTAGYARLTTVNGDVLPLTRGICTVRYSTVGKLENMDRCVGTLSVGTKVDRSMREFVESESDRLGISPAEFLRRLLVTYRESRDGNTACDHCGESVVLELTYA